MGRWDRSCWQDCRARERVHRSGFESTSMKCHEDSQRSDRLAVRVGHPRVVDRVVAPTLACLAWGSTDR